MDKYELQHGFEKVRHKVAKGLTKKPKYKFWDVYFPLFALSMSAAIPLAIVEEKPDREVTGQTEVVQQQLAERLALKSSETPLEQQRNFLHDVILAEDLSEGQARDMIREFNRNIGSVSEALGERVTGFGHLREARAENPGDPEAILKNMAEAEKPANTLRGLDGVLSLIFLAWLMGRGAKYGLRRTQLREWGEEAPRNPKYKH